MHDWEFAIHSNTCSATVWGFWIVQSMGLIGLWRWSRRWISDWTWSFGCIGWNSDPPNPVSRLDRIKKTTYLYVSFWWTSSQTHQLSLSLPWWSGKLQLLERSESWQRVLAWLLMGGLWLHQNLPHKMVKSVPKMVRNRKPSNKPLLRRFQHAVHAYQKSVHGIPNAKIHLCNLVEQICT